MRERTVIRVAMVCAMVGIGLASYLHYLHTGHEGLCTINSYIDCKKIIDATQYTAIILGIPNQIVALIGFSLVFSLGFTRLTFPNIRYGDKIIYMMTTLNIIGACIGTYLTCISTFVIGALCPYCVSAYACDLISLSFESTFLVGRFMRKNKNVKEAKGEKESTNDKSPA